jgi:hypothetical protein
MGKDQMAYRNSVAIVENFWNEVWKQPQNPDAIDRLVTEDFIIASGGNDICSRQEFKRWVKRFQAQVHEHGRGTADRNRVVQDLLEQGRHHPVHGAAFDLR